MAELAARWLQDRKVVGSNPAGSNSDRLVSITRIDNNNNHNNNNNNNVYFS